MDTRERFQLAKECFKDIKKCPISYEYLIERYLSKSGLGHIAPDVYQEYVKRLEEAGPDSKYFTIVTREKKPVKEVWEQQYFFIKGKEKIKAYLGETTPFYAQANDRKVDFKTMLTKGWKVITEDGVIINRESASDIHEKYSSHKLELLMLVKTENKVE